MTLNRLLILGLIMHSTILSAQDNSAQEVTIKSLISLQEKVIEIARDFPEDLFDFRPHPDSRSYIDEIWHISSGFGVMTARIQGKKPSAELINIPQNIKYDRELIIEHLTKNSNDYINLLKEQFDPNSIFTLAHLSQHYGKIVTIYRVNNLVPPNSRN